MRAIQPRPRIGIAGTRPTAPIQFGNQQSSGREGEGERLSGEVKSQSLEDTEATDAIVREIIDQQLGTVDPAELPATFDILAAGSYARREIVPASDLDIFFVVPEDVAPEKLARLKKIFTAIIAAVKEATKRDVDDESSGPVSHVLKMDERGGLVRDCRLLYRHREGAPSVPLTTGRESDPSDIVGTILRLIDQAIEEVDKRKKGAVDVKMLVYRPLHLFAHVLAQAHGFEETNSLAIVLRALKLHDTSFLRELLMRLQQVEALRRSLPKGGELVGHDIKGQIGWLKKFLGQMRMILQKYLRERDPILLHK